MRMPRKKIVGIRGAPLWMATLADLMTNLLTFFVLMAALTSAATPQETIDRINSIRSSFGGNSLSAIKSTEIFSSYVGLKMVEMDWKSADVLKGLNARMNSLNLGKQGGVYKIGKDISVVLPIDTIFTDRGWSLKKKVLPVLQEVGKVIENGDFQVRVAAYWDSPVSPVLFTQSSSIFTAKLSAQILRFILKQYKVESSRCSIVGYGDVKRYSKKASYTKADARKLVIIMKNPDLKPESMPEYGIFDVS